MDGFGSKGWGIGFWVAASLMAIGVEGGNIGRVIGIFSLMGGETSSSNYLEIRRRGLSATFLAKGGE